MLLEIDSGCTSCVWDLDWCGTTGILCDASHDAQTWRLDKMLAKKGRDERAPSAGRELMAANRHSSMRRAPTDNAGPEGNDNPMRPAATWPRLKSGDAPAASP